MRRSWVVLGVTATLLAACGSPTEPQPLQDLPRDLSAAERSLISSGNEFGLALFQRLAIGSPEENVILSPLSAYLALGMTANGADGETLEAMRATLAQAELSEDAANEAFRDLMELLLGLDEHVEFQLANSIWHRDDFPVRPAFVDLSRDYFDAVVEALDFDDPTAAATINAWVEEETRGRITDLIEEIDPEHVMFLVNALYFQGDWVEAFDPDDTRTADFRRLDGSRVPVPLMSRTGEVRHLARDGFQAVELLYGRGAFAMTVILPPEGTAPAELLEGVDVATWDEWMAGFEEREVSVELPRFRLEWEEVLNDALTAMGMGVAFDRDRADFARLAEEGAFLPGNLYITEVKQKTFIDVNEEGTEAAAATSVGVGVTSAPPTFRADRPFLFALRERFSGTVFFLGQVLDPTG